MVSDLVSDLKTIFSVPPQSEQLVFKKNITFDDCFPASTKQYKEVMHGDQVLQVRQP